MTGQDWTSTPTGTTVYLAAEGFEADLAAELGEPLWRAGRLMAAAGTERPAAWAANVWRNPVRIEAGSIKQAAKALRSLQRNWALWPTALHRRAALIEAQLPPVSAKPLAFPTPAPTAALGSWTLLEDGALLAAADCSSPFRHGEARFVEDRAGPPNRAYLKLWEALTRLGRYPRPGQRCLDLGASPGGWTWVLHRLGAQVTAVDKAPLAPELMGAPGIDYRPGSAFGLTPAEIGPVDWLCCDVICYPERLVRLVRAWHGSGLAANMVCTIKFQGATDHAAARALMEIPGSRLVHLWHNKHELTWLWPWEPAEP